MAVYIKVCAIKTAQTIPINAIKTAFISKLEKLMKDEALVITESADDGIYKIMAKGRIDATTADMLLAKLENALNEGQKVIILNMSQIVYLSSVGIRVILKIFKQAEQAGGSFNIERPSEIVKNVLGMVALEEMLVTY